MTKGRVNNKNLLAFYKGYFKLNNVELNPVFVEWLESKNPRGFEGWKFHLELKERAFKELMGKMEGQ
jgi:hypothetical protein